MVTYELNLDPAEDGPGWTAMVYRMVRAGVCGPWSGTVTVPGASTAMFIPASDLAGKALAALRLDQDFSLGEPEVYGRYGQVAVRVLLTPKATR